jgi:hypothetical protein
MRASDIIENIGASSALSWHLRHNHYPPVPQSMVPACEEAIALVADGDGETLVALPDGITWRDKDSAPAWAIVEGHHLHEFVEAYLSDYSADDPYNGDDECREEA